MYFVTGPTQSHLGSCIKMTGMTSVRQRAWGLLSGAIMNHMRTWSIWGYWCTTIQASHHLIQLWTMKINNHATLISTKVVMENWSGNRPKMGLARSFKHMQGTRGNLTIGVKRTQNKLCFSGLSSQIKAIHHARCMRFRREGKILDRECDNTKKRVVCGGK